MADEIESEESTTDEKAEESPIVNGVIDEATYHPSSNPIFLINDNASTGFLSVDSGTTSGGLTFLNPNSMVFEGSGRLTTPSGTQVEGRGGKEPGKRGKAKDIHPKLYFKYVKSKLSKVEVDKLKPRVAKLRGLAEDALKAGQVGLYEKILVQLAIMIREQEVDVAGFGTFVMRKDIDRFKNAVRGRVVEFCPLDEFPRVLPKPVQEKLATVKDKGLFDEFWVLHTNLTKEKAKSTAKKIREKDPILFGSFEYEKDGRLFYVADWVDEYCDLTFDEFTRIVKGVDKDYEPSQMREPTKEEVAAILEEVKTHHKKWNDSYRRSWRDAADESENVKRALGQDPEPEPEPDPEPPKRWWQFWR